MPQPHLIVHHLGHSQKERIVWLCEELSLEYQLKRYARREDNRMAPPEYQALHPLGIAPVLSDGPLVLGESGASPDTWCERGGMADSPSNLATLLCRLPLLATLRQRHAAASDLAESGFSTGSTLPCTIQHCSAVEGASRARSPR